MQPGLATCLAGLGLLAGAQALAQPLPLWDAGLGVAALQLPDYRGAASSSQYLLPFPYLVYRGQQLRIDERRGVRNLLWHNRLVELDISLNGAMPVNSEHTLLRNGMPNLDPVFEIGPSLEIPLSKNHQTHTHWSFNLPIRAVFSTNFRTLDQQGWVTHPQLEFVQLFPMPSAYLRLNLSVGPLFASREYHGYYYDVHTDQATSWRPAYRSHAGYSGTRVYTSLSRHFDHRYRLGGFVMTDLLHGARFTDSPLVETKRAVYLGLYFSWILASSSQHSTYGTD